MADKTNPPAEPCSGGTPASNQVALTGSGERKGVHLAPKIRVDPDHLPEPVALFGDPQPAAIVEAPAATTPDTPE